jgi:hypothetical protein
MYMADFRYVAPCSLVEVHRRFGGACCLHHQDDHAHHKPRALFPNLPVRWEVLPTPLDVGHIPYYSSALPLSGLEHTGSQVHRVFNGI